MSVVSRHDSAASLASLGVSRMGSLLLTPQTSGLGLTGQPKPTTSIKIAYKPSPGGDGPAGLKDVTLKITSSHTVAKAVDKVVKALATRYVQYGKADPADFALVLPSKTASKLGYSDVSLLGHSFVSEGTRLLMLHVSDEELELYTTPGDDSKLATREAEASRPQRDQSEKPDVQSHHGGSEFLMPKSSSETPRRDASEEPVRSSFKGVLHRQPDIDDAPRTEESMSPTKQKHTVTVKSLSRHSSQASLLQTVGDKSEGEESDFYGTPRAQRKARKSALSFASVGSFKDAPAARRQSSRNLQHAAHSDDRLRLSREGSDPLLNASTNSRRGEDAAELPSHSNPQPPIQRPQRSQSQLLDGSNGANASFISVRSRAPSMQSLHSRRSGGSPKAVDLERTASARSALSTMPASRNDARSLQLARRSLGHSDFCAQYAPASVSVACQASETAVETVLLQTSGDQSPWQLDGAALATELRLFRQRQRVTDPIARTADFFVADVADVQPEYPSGSLFKMSYQEKYQSLTASVRGLKDPVLSSLAEAVDDERESMIAAVSAVQRESQELRHGWLAETSKVERLLGCVASLLQDRDALFAALSNRGRMDAEYLVRHVNRQVNTRLSLHHAEVDVLRQRVEWHKARAAAVDTLQDALKSQPKAPPTPASTTEAQDEWTAERRAQDNEKLNATPRKPDKPVEGEPEGSVQRRLDHVIALLESKGPSSPRLDDARMDQHLLQRIKDLEDENDAMAQRVALFETKTTLLKSAQGLPLEAGDEARLLTERVVQLEGDLIREKDLRQQYAVQSEVIKQIGVQEILRQKEHITLQHTVLANAGLDIEQSMSPMRPSFPMFSHTQVPNRYLSKFQ